MCLPSPGDLVRPLQTLWDLALLAYACLVTVQSTRHKYGPVDISRVTNSRHCGMVDLILKGVDGLMTSQRSGRARAVRGRSFEKSFEQR